MAKRKRRKTSKKQYQWELVAFVCFVLAILGIFQFGFIGQIMKAFGRLVMGEAYVFAFLLLAVSALWRILTGKHLKLKSRLMIGLVACVPLLLLLWHSLVFHEIAKSGASLLQVTFDRASLGFKGDFGQEVAGGMLGAVFYQVTYFAVGQWGTFLLVGIGLLALVLYLLEMSWQEFLEGIQGVSHLVHHWLTDFSKKAKTYSKSLQSKDSNKKDAKGREPQPLQEEEGSPSPIIKNYQSSQAVIVTEETSSPVEIVHGVPGQTPLQDFTGEENAKEEGEEETEWDHDLDQLTIGAEAENPNYLLPPTKLLNPIKRTDQSGEYSVIQDHIKTLEKTFMSFNVDAKVTKANLGPAVTKYEIEPAVGTKVSKITNLADDIALALAAKDIRIEAPIPGKSVIGIEVPNQQISVVSFRESFEHQPAHAHLLEVPLGRAISGNTCMADLTKMPHLLIAGSTGSGKSVCINGMIISILMKAKPNQVKLMMIDPKKVELNVYNGIPHLLTPVVTNPRKAAQALNKVVEEMERRYELFASTGQRNIDGYNQYLHENAQDTDHPRAKLPYIIVVVDELADLMMVASKEVEAAITRLAQMARAAGIHMILATQRPSVDVITGIIKANVPSRIAFAVSSGTDSRTIIDQNGAEKLLGRGDMLFMPMGEGKPIRVQGAYITDEEVERIVDFVKNQQEANYVEAMMTTDQLLQGTDEDLDEMWEEVIDFVKQRETVSISMLQRRFRIGYNRAARLVDDMEAHGIISPASGSKPRTVIIYKENQDHPS